MDPTEGIAVLHKDIPRTKKKEKKGGGGAGHMVII